MEEAERLRAYAEGCLYLADGVRDLKEAERLRRLAADALAQAEALDRQPFCSSNSRQLESRNSLPVSYEVFRP